MDLPLGGAAYTNNRAFFSGSIWQRNAPLQKNLKLPRHSANWPRHSAMARQGPARQPLAPHTQTTALFLILRQFGRETHRTRPCRSFFPGTRPIGRGTRLWPVKAPVRQPAAFCFNALKTSARLASSSRWRHVPKKSFTAASFVFGATRQRNAPCKTFEMAEALLSH